MDGTHLRFYQTGVINGGSMFQDQAAEAVQHIGKRKKKRAFSTRFGTMVFLISIAASSGRASDKPASSQAPPLTPEQQTLLQKAAQQEQLMVKVIQHHVPLVETYIQHMRQDPQMGPIPFGDVYMLGRVDFGGTFTADAYAKGTSKKGRGAQKFISGMTDAFRVKFSPNGFVDMMFVDAGSFDQQHYDFSYVRREFLGDVRVLAFDVQPKPHTGAGRFEGRIWVEDQDGSIVRFTGTFSGGTRHNLYFHFDSWRSNVQPHVWLPTSVYVEDADFKGQTHFWGYSLKMPGSGSESESVVVENATDASDNSQDMSPIQSQHAWVNQTEQNVLERLTRAGLLAVPSEFDQVLETVTNNLVIGNKLSPANPIHCRVLLTSSLESVAIGNTIVVSKGLIDVLPSEEALASVLSFQLAHILLGHQIDTKYAFNDLLLFPDDATLQRINMNHTEQENEQAAKKAVELLHSSVYADKLQNVGLFMNQLVDREKGLPTLLTPRLGDALVRRDGQPWMSDLTNGAPELQTEDLNQIAALPLGSQLRIDPWDDKVYRLHAKPVALVSPRDKMPFQVTPIFYHLSRYQAQDQTTAPMNAAGGAEQPNSTAQPH